MRSLFRPSLLILLSVVLALGATGLVLWPRGTETRALPLRDDEHEIVWLNPAVNASAWERFVAAVRQAAKRLNEADSGLNLEVVETAAFPRETTVIPEVVVTVRGDQKLVFRWYKLTNDQRTEAWVKALLDRPRPPLAIIGGSSSDPARDLAWSLREQVAKKGLRSGPQLLLTTATADRVSDPDGGTDIALHDLYPGRTFRFCFTNQQMAHAVTEFVWSRDELRPDTAPVYVSQWEDDAYSKDLTARFCESLNVALDAHGPSQFPVSSRIDYSVGGFDEPNRWEGPAIKYLLDTKIQQNGGQRRPVLVLSAPSTQPARRFLRGLAAAAPVEARRFVVVTGDAIPFNTVYRDRNVAWRVQDLPFDLVFFSHRNPVSLAAGFPGEPYLHVLAADTVTSFTTPNLASGITQLLGVKRFQDAFNLSFPGENGAHSGSATTASEDLLLLMRHHIVVEHHDVGATTGTEDLLLFMDIIEALTQAVRQGDAMPADGDALGARLRHARWQAGRVSFNEDYPPLFDDNGNRRGATGEHIVWLHPQIDGERVQPRSKIQVFGWRASRDVAARWVLVRRLVVDYE